MRVATIISQQTTATIGILNIGDKHFIFSSVSIKVMAMYLPVIPSCKNDMTFFEILENIRIEESHYSMPFRSTWEQLIANQY